ncbi:MAG: excinuclease ABC subunit UvrA [Spirochaetes bacterium]|nr:excinuclease ABC subunit UvrA [Spirochaetota bacterium]
MKNYNLRSIGTVAENDSSGKIIISNEYIPALLHIGKFSHVIVFWIRRNRNMPDKFNCNSGKLKQLFEKYIKYSLSPINLSVAKIINVNEESGSMELSGCIIPGSAVIVDIKPYFPVEDRVKQCLVPDEFSVLPPFVPENNIAFSGHAVIREHKNSTAGTASGTEIKQNGIIRKKDGKCLIELTDADYNFFDFLNNFSHIQILWWFSRFEKDNFRKTTQCDPPYEKAPRTGVFASRSPVRPNPVGLTTARILEIVPKKKIIEINAIDAFDKTPVLDIRPYIPFINRVEKCVVPVWVDHWSEWFTEQERGSGSENIALTDSDFSRLCNLSGFDKTQAEPQPEPVPINASVIENSAGDFIAVIGAKENNLKNISLKIPKNKMTVITGLSGSGKSTLAFDTIYAESRRRFMDSISSTGKQFFKQFERPAVDQILNLPPAIAVEQKAISRNARSTVGTVSEINDYLRLLYARIGVRHCPECGRAVEPKTASEIANLLLNMYKGTSFTIASVKDNKPKGEFAVPAGSDAADFSGKLNPIIKEILEKESGAFQVLIPENDAFILHTRNHCYYCGKSFFELTPSYFSNNNPESMCPDCSGLGTQMNVSPDLIVACPDKSILDSASGWWGDLKKFINKPTGNWMKGEVIALAQSMNIDLEIPWNKLPDEFRQKALFGTEGETVNLSYRGSKGRSGDISRPVEGAVNHIKRLFRVSHGKASSEFYLQFMDEKECPACHGEQLSSEARYITVAGKRFPEITAMSINSLHEWLRKLPENLSKNQMDISREIIESILQRAESLINTGLHYLTLKRSLPTLSGGEAQRLRLSTQLGCGLTNLLYILDEPSVGLHHSDHKKLINTMKRLRDNGNTLIVVEHDEDTMLEADHLIDMGPGAGMNGGQITAQGTPDEIMQNNYSLTGRYLRKKIITGSGIKKNARTNYGYLTLKGACKNNLKNINVSFPLGMFICITGKSGSGKSSLITKTLSPLLKYYYDHGILIKGDYDALEGAELIDNVITITQEAIGRSPRSNPATYTGVFEEIREIFASTPQAKNRKYTANRFSFNSKDGRCDSCEGDGRKKIEMNFMPDVWITCPDCDGKRFNKETLEIIFKNKSIADIMEMDINEAAILFSDNGKISQILNTLKDVGLGYLKLGQSALTLSGGEAQRVKLSRELSKIKTGKCIYIIDEPSTGLHFSDIDHLLVLIHRIVDSGNTVIIIEHNTDIIKNADWIIELGPEGGDNGGYIIYEGTPDNLIYNHYRN